MSLRPVDQAEGLRRMFGGAGPRFVPVVSNPHLGCGGVVLERLTTAWAERGASTLVVDAAERAGEAGEMAMVDLGQCIERLAPKVSFLAARGLPIRFVDSTGSTAAFLHTLADAAPDCDTVFVHATAPELARLFSTLRRPGGAHAQVGHLGGAAAHAAADLPCPIVIASDRPASVTHAYAAMKLLAQRAGLIVCDFVLAASPTSPRADRIVAKVASVAESFFGGVLRHVARIDPEGHAADAAGPDLQRLAAARTGRRLDREIGHERASRAAVPRFPAPAFSLTSDRVAGHASP